MEIDPKQPRTPTHPVNGITLSPADVHEVAAVMRRYAHDGDLNLWPADHLRRILAALSHDIIRLEDTVSRMRLGERRPAEIWPSRPAEMREWIEHQRGLLARSVILWFATRNIIGQQEDRPE